MSVSAGGSGVAISVALVLAAPFRPFGKTGVKAGGSLRAGGAAAALEASRRSARSTPPRAAGFRGCRGGVASDAADGPASEPAWIAVLLDFANSLVVSYDR
jgi:hypothetical protein